MHLTRVLVPSALGVLACVAACASETTSTGGLTVDSGPGLDVAAPDAAIEDTSAPDVVTLPDAPVDASNAAGCADGTREGLSAVTYPNVAACAGTWTGLIEKAQFLCAGGWHTCNGLEPALNALAYADAEQVVGCFGLDAAQDSFQCVPGCTAAVGKGVDTAENIDMGAIGSTCAYKFPGSASCIAGGRIDFSENSGTGCSFAPGLSGVVCCKDL